MAIEQKRMGTAGVARPPQEDFLRIQDLLGLCLGKWWWFVISLGVTLSVAVLYLMMTPSVYTRSAAVMIKDNSKGGSASVGAEEFADLGLFKNSSNVYNELQTMKSPALMEEVVSRLGLNETFTVKEGLKPRELYKCAPIVVIFNDPSRVGVSFTIELSAQNQFTLDDFSYQGEDFDDRLTGVLGDSIQTPVGTLILSATADYKADYYGKSIRYSRGAIDEVANAYSSKLNAAFIDDESTVINLSIADASTQKAEDILNSLIQIYNEHWILDKNQIAISTSQFINERLGVIERELGNVDDSISSFKSEHLLPDVQAASNLYLTQSATNRDRLMELTNQMTAARVIRQSLNRQFQLLPANLEVGNNVVNDQIREYNALLQERIKLLSNSSERNPYVRDLTDRALAMQEVIVKSVDNLITNLNSQIQSVRTQDVETRAQIASNPNQAKYLLSVERQQKVKESLYLYLLQKREENELSQAFTAYNNRVITPPRGSMIPTAPVKKNILLVAFALGLLIPVVIIFMRETMNSRVRGRKDLERLSVPFAGEIPLSTDAAKRKIGSRQKEKDGYLLVVKEGARDVLNEAFRVARTNLEFMTGTNETHQALMLTSFNPGSGKTFITLNLGASLALREKRVLLIDLDMRRASLSGVVNKPSNGLSDYLVGRLADWRTAIVPVPEMPNLSILPVGTVPPNPTELLLNPRMAALLAAARADYDYLIYDCPPVEVVADASIIAQWADTTLFVVRAGLMEREMLPVVEQLYADKKFKNMALLLNGTTVAYGYKNYGYRYGYHYGYGHYAK